jgi:hypothetical protein
MIALAALSTWIQYAASIEINDVTHHSISHQEFLVYLSAAHH